VERDETLSLFTYKRYKPFPIFSAPFPSFPADASLSKDAALARLSAAVAHYIEWKTELEKNLQMLLLESKLNLRFVMFFVVVFFC
jgi:hypothetical protein